jgi:hypothetical protein
MPSPRHHGNTDLIIERKKTDTEKERQDGTRTEWFEYPVCRRYSSISHEGYQMLDCGAVKNVYLPTVQASA